MFFFFHFHFEFFVQKTKSAFSNKQIKKFFSRRNSLMFTQASNLLGIIMEIISTWHDSCEKCIFVLAIRMNFGKFPYLHCIPAASSLAIRQSIVDKSNKFIKLQNVSPFCIRSASLIDRIDFVKSQWTLNIPELKLNINSVRAGGHYLIWPISCGKFRQTVQFHFTKDQINTDRTSLWPIGKCIINWKRIEELQM